MEILRVENLRVESRDGKVLLDDVSFKVFSGEIVGILGESGSGKSLTALALAGLLPANLNLSQGKVFIKGKNLYELKDTEKRKIRGKILSLIFQDALSALNPVLKVKEQIEEVLKEKLEIKDKREFKQRALNLLKEVNISYPELRLNSYPFELSGGIRQRVMIACAIAGDPEIIIADEPTTALDPPLKYQIIHLLKKLNQKKGKTILFITHELDLLKNFVKKVIVFFRGKVVEISPWEIFFNTPFHPYSQVLTKILKEEGKVKKFFTGEKIPVKGCPFYPWCEFRKKGCEKEIPPLIPFKDSFVRCFNYG